jgi:transcriptional regulator with XRE-family HTH domain
MISPPQVRAARGLVGWSQKELAAKAGVALMAVKRLEYGAVVTRDRTYAAIETALSDAGVIFLPPADGRGEGVCLSVSTSDSSSARGLSLSANVKCGTTVLVASE